MTQDEPTQQASAVQRAGHTPSEQTVNSKVELQLKKREVNVAVVSVIATVIVALAGAVSTVVLATVNSNEQRIQTAEEFIRTKQQETYSQFITAANALRNAQSDHWQIVKDMGSGPESKDAKEGHAEQALKAVRELKTLVSLVELVAAANVREAAQAVVAQAVALDDLVNREALLTGPGNEPTMDQRQKVHDEDVKLEELIKSFVNVAASEINDAVVR